MRLLGHQLRGEQLLFWRSRELAFFTFVLPILFFVLLGSVYGKDTIDSFKGSHYLLVGMLGYGVAATAFAGLAISLVVRRESGVLKRLRATPLPPFAYVGGVIGSTLFVYALEAVALVVLGRLLFGVPFPHRWFSLVLTLLLGGVAFAALALALTGVIRTAEGSSAVVNAIYLPMTFISGSFFSAHSFPRFVRAIAEVLPLTHFIRLVRAVMLGGHEIWSRPSAVGVVAAWGAAGAILALRGFRWEPTEG
jgi:ABC-2 type transport system permease protein